MQAEVIQEKKLYNFIEVYPDANSWETTSCLVCGKDDHLKDVVKQEGTYEGSVISICTNCQFVFRRRKPSEAWVREYYKNNWDQEGAENVKHNRVNKEPNYTTLNFVGSALKPNARVLEIGAGFGDTAVTFKKAGHSLFGIEASEHRARYVREVLGIECQNVAIEDLNTEEKFDYIYTNHVLEHINYPKEAISAAKKVLKPGGLLSISIPDFYSEFLPQIIHFVPHLSFFTSESIQKLLISLGFTVLKVEVDQEIRILGRLDENADTGIDSSPQQREEFQKKIEEYYKAELGHSNGYHLLVWYKEKNKYFRYKVLSGSEGKLNFQNSLFKFRERVPRKLWKNVLPGIWGTPKLWSLTVKVSDYPKFPIIFKYKEKPPIWVK